MIKAVTALISACAALLFNCAAQAALTCQPSTLGAPCALGGIATQAAAEPELNLGVGNPIHLVTGNKYQLEHDLPPSLRTPLLEISRHYNALDQRPSPLGRGWTLAYDTRLHVLAGRWQVVQADGSRIIFTGTDEQRRENRHGTLRRQGQQWLWTWPDASRLRFDADGHLVGLARGPAPGHSLSIQRHDAGPLRGRIAKVTDGNGHALIFDYLIHHRHAYLRHIDTPAGRFQYHYQPVDGLADVPAGTASHPGFLRLHAVTRPDGMQRRYLHEAQRQAGNRFHLTGIEIAAAGGKAGQRLNTWSYDTQGRAVLSIEGPPDSGRNEIHIDYLRTPSASQRGMTIVRSAQGRQTRFRTALQGGRHVLLEVEGTPCPGCAAAGSRASYNSRGRLISINGTAVRRHPSGRIRQLAPRTPGWPGLALDFNEQGRRISWRSADTGTERAVHDAQGRLLRRLFANGDHWDYGYNAAGRLATVTANTSGGAHETTRLSWQGATLTRIDHPHETETRQYDAKHRLILRTVQRHDNSGGTAHAYTERFAYDTLNRLIAHHLPEGGKLVYQWGPGRRLQSINWHDAQGREHPVIQSEPSQPGYSYSNGLRLHATLHQGRTHQLALQDQHHALLWLQRVDYDAGGRIDHETHHTPAVGHTESWRYAYDRADRLIGAEQRAETMGTRPAMSAPTNDAAHGMSPLLGTGPHTAPYWYAWNDNGSLAALRSGDTTHKPAVKHDESGLPTHLDGATLSFGPQRRLTSVVHNGTRVASYTHNAFGHRIRKRTGTETEAETGTSQTDYFYLGDKLVAEALPGDPTQRALPITRRYIYAHHVLVGMVDYTGPETQSRLYAVHADLLGAPRLITDDRQSVRWFATYSPTGQASRRAGDLSFSLRLPGQIADAETGWHDNLLRTYLPALGQYLEPDPLGPTPASQAHGYAAQQPRRYIDPTGLLLFAFDGTRSTPETLTNIWKMSQRYLDGPVFYHSGPGKASYADWDSVTAYSAARILDTQWLHLLNALSQPPLNPGDTIPIDIIGFSRGAALARHFGNLINDHVNQGQFSYHDERYGQVTACVDLRFMGLFDTVAQFGLGGIRNSEYDLGISPAWGWVAHAVALQEYRRYFPLSSTQDAGAGYGQNIIEAPFIGAHADIGGGAAYTPGSAPENGDLSDVALNWMLWQARAVALGFNDGEPGQREITHPIVHDERTVATRPQGGDRPVDAADGTRLNRFQAEHARLGAAQRHATEALITRYEGWQLRGSSDVGVVDMSGYALWLQLELGWHDLPA